LPQIFYMKSVTIVMVCLAAMGLASFVTYEMVAPKTNFPQFNHAAYYVKSLAVSTKFYEETIGLEKIPEPFHDGKHTWFSTGQGHLHVIEGAAEITEHDKNTHFCLSVPNFDDFKKRLDDLKYPYENWAGDQLAVTKRVDGIQQLYLKDPDGYWVEINSDYQTSKPGKK
jgi:lactoylglutathione lyase